MSNSLPFLTSTVASSGNNLSLGFNTPTSTASTASLFPSSDDNREVLAYREYGLNSPPKGLTAIPCSKAKEKIEEDNLWGKCEKDDDTKRLLFFLYGRGFMADSKRKRRVKAISKMMGSKKSKERFLRLLCASGDINLLSDHETDPKVQEIYDKNTTVLAFYFQQTNTKGFLRDMTTAKYFFRFQKSGNCFLQAPCIMMSYLSQKCGFEATDPVDLSKFVRHAFTDKELKDYVSKDNGGDAKYVLGRLLQLYGEKGDNVVFEHSFHCTVKSQLEEIFKEYGPLLVRNFHVHKNFGGGRLPNVEDDAVGYFQYSGSNQCRARFVLATAPDIVDTSFQAVDEEIEVSADEYYGTLDSAKTPSATGTHAMIMIGIRIDKNNRIWCLLQNWWQSMQLVEVSLDYLENCKASFCFYGTGTGFDMSNSTIE